jgi:hypothetical protein
VSCGECLLTKTGATAALDFIIDAAVLLDRHCTEFGAERKERAGRFGAEEEHVRGPRK